MPLPLIPLNVNCLIAGRLKHFLPNWERITQDPWILQVVKGYPIDFSETPVQVHPPKPMIVSVENQVLIETKVQKLAFKEAIHLLSPIRADQGFLSTLFLVPNKAGKGGKGGGGGGGEEGGTTPCGKLETFESKHPLRTLQDGGDPYVEGPVEKRGLFSQNRSERCLPNRTHLA